MNLIKRCLAVADSVAVTVTVIPEFIERHAEVSWLVHLLHIKIMQLTFSTNL